MDSRSKSIKLKNYTHDLHYIMNISCSYNQLKKDGRRHPNVNNNGELVLNKVCITREKRKRKGHKVQSEKIHYIQYILLVSVVLKLSGVNAVHSLELGRKRSFSYFHKDKIYFRLGKNVKNMRNFAILRES